MSITLPSSNVRPPKAVTHRSPHTLYEHRLLEFPQSSQIYEKLISEGQRSAQPALLGVENKLLGHVDLNVFMPSNFYFNILSH